MFKGVSYSTGAHTSFHYETTVQCFSLIFGSPTQGCVSVVNFNMELNILSWTEKVIMVPKDRDEFGGAETWRRTILVSLPWMVCLL